MTRPSNVNRDDPVPANPTTSTFAMATTLLVATAARHVTVVPAVHEDVVQSTLAMEAVGVVSSEANDTPLSVALGPPLCGMFCFASPDCETTGAAVRQQG